jgi:hypothetical protein
MSNAPPNFISAASLRVHSSSTSPAVRGLTALLLAADLAEWSYDSFRGLHWVWEFYRHHSTEMRLVESLLADVNRSSNFPRRTVLPDGTTINLKFAELMTSMAFMDSDYPTYAAFDILASPPLPQPLQASLPWWTKHDLHEVRHPAADAYGPFAQPSRVFHNLAGPGYVHLANVFAHVGTHLVVAHLIGDAVWITWPRTPENQAHISKMMQGATVINTAAISSLISDHGPMKGATFGLVDSPRAFVILPTEIAAVIVLRPTIYLSIPLDSLRDTQGLEAMLRSMDGYKAMPKQDQEGPLQDLKARIKLMESRVMMAPPQAKLVEKIKEKMKTAQ